MSTSGNLPTVTSPPWSTATKRIVGFLVLGIVLLVMRQVSGTAWRTLIIAVLFAYLLSPVVTFFERRMNRLHSYDLQRTLAVFLTWIVVVGVMALVLVLIVPATVNQLRQFANDLPSLIAQTEDDLREFLSQPIMVGNFTLVPWEEIEGSILPSDETTSGNSLTDALQTGALTLADSAINVVGGALSFLITLTILFVMLFYLMRDGPLFVGYLVESLPESYHGDARRLIHELGAVWNAYLRGQLLLNLAVGIATYIVALILGLPQPLLLALVAGFLELIPNIGPAIAMIPALLFAVTTDSATIPGLDAGLLYALITGMSWTLIQQLEATFLVPRILGNSLDLHPFVVLTAVLIGTSLGGVLGIVLAAPATASLRVLLRYLRGKLLDEEMFPAVAPYAAQPRGFIYRLMHFWLSKRFPVMSPEALDDWAMNSDAVGGESREPVAR